MKKAAEWLVININIKLLGTDYISVVIFAYQIEPHRASLLEEASSCGMTQPWYRSVHALLPPISTFEIKSIFCLMLVYYFSKTWQAYEENQQYFKFTRAPEIHDQLIHTWWEDEDYQQKLIEVIRSW